MWKETKLGYYTNGEDELRIQQMSHETFYIFINEEFEKEIESLQDLHAYLKIINAEPLQLPTLEVECNKWIAFEGSDGCYEKAFTRKLEDGTLQTVIFANFKNRYSLMLRETTYDDVHDLLMDALEFAEQKGKNAKDVLELDAYEAMNHGASGMDKCHHNLQTMDEVYDILQNKYGIAEKI